MDFFDYFYQLFLYFILLGLEQVLSSRNDAHIAPLAVGQDYSPCCVQQSAYLLLDLITCFDSPLALRNQVLTTVNKGQFGLRNVLVIDVPVHKEVWDAAQA